MLCVFVVNIVCMQCLCYVYCGWTSLFAPIRSCVYIVCNFVYFFVYIDKYCVHNVGLRKLYVYRAIVVCSDVSQCVFVVACVGCI